VSEATGLKSALAVQLVDINRRHRVSGTTMAVDVGKSSVVQVAVGADAKGRKLHTGSLFAVASVTKLATALLTLRMVDQQRLDLKADVRQYLPAHLTWPGDKVTITHLLTHTAGVKRDDPDRVDPAWARGAYRCVRKAPSNPGQFFSYADCHYEILGVAIQTVHPLGFRRALSVEVLEPLRIRGILWGGKRHVARLSGGLSSLYRPLRLRRHEGTPAAGLITDAVGAMTLARAFGGNEQLLDPKLVSLATSDQTHTAISKDDLWSPHPPWGLGPEIRGHKKPHYVPQSFGEDSVGHFGSSGCLAWSAPGRGVSWSILSTRTIGPISLQSDASSQSAHWHFAYWADIGQSLSDLLD
jgi:CubicO group peptidase (beta-lactamase class C family)